MASRSSSDASAILAREQAARKASTVNGKHYSEWCTAVRALKREGRFDMAEALLIQLAAAADAEADIMAREPAPWYSEQLRIVRKKLSAQRR